MVIMKEEVCMAKVVYKYELDPDKIETDLPIGAKVLSVGAQGGSMFIWALVDPSAKTEVRKFVVVGTGHKMVDAEIDKLQFIGTAHMHGGRLVWHVFEMV